MVMVTMLGFTSKLYDYFRNIYSYHMNQTMRTELYIEMHLRSWLFLEGPSTGDEITKLKLLCYHRCIHLPVSSIFTFTSCAMYFSSPFSLPFILCSHQSQMSSSTLNLFLTNAVEIFDDENIQSSHPSLSNHVSNRSKSSHLTTSVQLKACVHQH